MKVELATVKRLGAVRLPGLSAPPPASGKLFIINKGVAPGSKLKRGDPVNQASLMVLDLKSGKVTKRLKLEDQAHEILMAADGKRAVIPHFVDWLPRHPDVQGSALTILDLAKSTRRLIELPGFTGAHGLEWIDADRVAVTADGRPPDNDGFILEVNVRAGRIERALPTHQADTHLVRLSKDRKTYFATDLSGTFTAIDRASGRQEKLMRTGEGTEGFDLSPDGRELWVAAKDAGQGRITVLDAKTLERKASFAAAGGPIRVLFMPGGKHALLSNYKSNDISVIDTRTRKEVKRIPLEVPRMPRDGETRRGSSGPMMIALHPTAHQAWVASERSRVVTAFDTRTWQVLGYVKAGTAPDPLAFVP